MVFIYISLQLKHKDHTIQVNVRPSSSISTQSTVNQASQAPNGAIDIDALDIILEEDLLTNPNYKPTSSNDCSNSENDDEEANIPQLIGTRGGKKQSVSLNLCCIPKMFSSCIPTSL